MSSISKEEIWRTLRRKTGYYWAEEYATSQLHRNSHMDEYVMLFQRVNFWQYFVCLCKRIFNCCNVLMLSWSWSSRSNSKWLSPRYYLSVDAILPRQSYSDITSSQCRGCGSNIGILHFTAFKYSFICLHKFGETTN